MNKKELVKKVAVKTGLTQKDSAAAINAAFETIADTVKSGKNVTLLGFGTFMVRQRQARKGVNPYTRKPMKIEAKKVCKFTPGNKMKLDIL